MKKYSKSTNDKNKIKDENKNTKISFLLLYIIVTLIAILIRCYFIKFKSNDYTNALSLWFNHIKKNGGLFAMKKYKGDYEPLYNTILALLTYIPVNSLITIKTVSIIGDFVLAFASARLVGIILNNANKNKNYINKAKLITYSIILLLPNVVINSSKWGQCDSIYTSFIILSLGDLFSKKYKRMFVFLGIAFAFKLQTIFILPLFITIYFCKKEFPWYNFLIIPIMLIICSIPAMCFGMPFSKIFTCFNTQVSEYNDVLQCNFPNIYQFIFVKKTEQINIITKLGILCTLLLDFIIFIFTIKHKENLNDENILFLGIIYIIVETYFLPRMHDRYLYVGEILSVIYTIIYLKNYILSIFLNIQAVAIYQNYLSKNIATFNSKYGINIALSIIFIELIIIYVDKYFLQMKGNTIKNE